MFLRKLGNLLQKLLKKIDLFPTDQFVRYNGESEYTTATGGLVSLALIVVILILFSNKGIQTLDRSTISSSISTKFEVNPSPIKVITSPKGGFMFAVGLFNINLNDPTVTYFNITLFQNYYSPLWQVINYTQVPLVPCTSQHFNFDKDILSMYQKFGLEDALCPPLDYAFEVGGRMTSDVFSQFNIYILKCDSNLTSNCASDADMKSKGSFTFIVPIVNTIVNPNDQDQVQTYLEDRNYYTLGSKLGFNAYADIARHQINTDISIMPYEDISTQYVTTVPNLLRSSSFQIVDEFYGSVAFSKSSSVTTYSRSFNKLDNFVSYIGGFVGAALVLFFLLKAYSEKAFLIQVGSHLFRDEREGYKLTRFSFLDNIGVGMKDILGILRIPCGWQRGQILSKTIEETQAQIDVALLLRRVAFLESAISVLFGPHQLATLHLTPKRLLREAEQQMVKYKQPFDIQDIQQKTDHQPKNIEEENSSKAYSSKGGSRQKLDKLKSSFERVLSQSNQGNLISRRIIQKLNPVFVQKIGTSQVFRSKIIELKQRSIKDLSASNHELNFESLSKNAIYNEFEDIPKPIPKQEFVFQLEDN